MSGSRTTCSYSQVPSLSQSLTQSSNPRRNKLVKHASIRGGPLPVQRFGVRLVVDRPRRLPHPPYCISGNRDDHEEFTQNEPSPGAAIPGETLFVRPPFTLLAPVSKSKVVTLADVWDQINRFILGFACCGVGLIGLGCIWYRVGHNYVWLLSSIFIPGVFNGVSGLISTFVNIYSSQDGIHYNKLIFTTIGASGGYAVICGFLTMIYTILKDIVKRRHDRVSSQKALGNYRV